MEETIGGRDHEWRRLWLEKTMGGGDMDEGDMVGGPCLAGMALENLRRSC